MQILLDLDGVLANFYLDYLRLVGREQLYYAWPQGENEIPKVLEWTDEQFWEQIKPGFFAGLPRMDDFDQIIDLVKFYDPEFHICTSPGPHAFASADKVEWMYDVFGSNFRNFIITKNKYRLATPRTVLIDDWDKQTTKFATAGGRSILIPRKWNARYGVAHDAVSVVRFELAYLHTVI